jgi:DNA-binding transcriptional ArsR family regulator
LLDPHSPAKERSTYQDIQLNAIGDPTRRAILANLKSRPRSVSELAERFLVSRPAILQHLLERNESCDGSSRRDATNLFIS